MNDVKPGWKTTEFWVTISTIFGSIISLFVLFGKLTPEQGKTITDTALALATPLLALIGVSLANAHAAAKYSASRAAVKNKE